MIVAAVIAILSNWKLLQTEDGDFKDALCYDMALVPNLTCSFDSKNLKQFLATVCFYY